MAHSKFRRVFLATLLVSTPLLFSACAPAVRDADVVATPAAVEPVADAAAVMEPSVAEPVAVDPATQVAEIELTVTRRSVAPSDYKDIFDRIRAGYQLEDPSELAVDTQLAWYARNPEYIERTFGRGELYLHYIVTQLEARGMPTELALLPVVESAYEPFGYSHARAAGLWQFISDTGRRFGLKQNWWYDGRRDVVESTRAALDYLSFLHEEFNGDWLLAIASYNCGEVAVQRAIDANLASGKPTDFWHLKLPRETRAYVPKLLAMRRLVEHPGDYGLEFSPIANQPYFAAVDTGGQIDLRMASELAGITHEELSDLNPAFNRWATDPEGPYQLLVPAQSSALFTEALAQVPTDQRVRVKYYTVQSGDTLSLVSRRTATSMSVLKQLNALQSSKLRPGQSLILPDLDGPLPAKVVMAAARADGRILPTRRGFHVVRRGESLWAIAQRSGVDVHTLASWNGMKVGDTLRAGRKIVLRSGAGKARAVVAGSGEKTLYTVRSGDTLWHIAKRFSVSVSQLLSWNGMSKNQRLLPGQRLIMYAGG